MQTIRVRVLSMVLAVVGAHAAAPEAAEGQAAPSSKPSAKQAAPATKQTTPSKPRAKPSAPAQACPHGQPLREEGKVATGEVEELSGLVASRQQPGVLWVHNDSGDEGKLYALDTRGKLLLKVKLEHVDPKDVEDIAIGKDPSGADALYLADTGDNDHKREHVRLLRLREPTVLLGEKQEKQKVAVHKIEVRYEDGPRDVETLLIDPRDGDAYLVEKAPLLALTQPVGVYRIAASELEAGKAVARRVARVPMGPATAGDVLPDGSAVAVRSYTRLLLWPRKPEESLAEALSRPGCPLPLADVGQQGEAFGFMPGGAGYYTSTEGKHAPIYSYSLKKK